MSKKRTLVTCKDCGKQWGMRTSDLKVWQGRCHPCAVKMQTGPNNSRWKGGRPTCKNCGKLIWHGKKTGYCISCVGPHRSGPRSGVWKGGKPRCIDCGKQLNYYSRRCPACMAAFQRGPNCPAWKGGITPEHTMIRTSPEYKQWRQAVYERDNYTCVLCGDTRGGNLNADHILPFADFPDQRFDVSNGRTLCEACHQKQPTNGGRASRIIRRAVAFFTAHPLALRPPIAV